MKVREVFSQLRYGKKVCVLGILLVAVALPLTLVLARQGQQGQRVEHHPTGNTIIFSPAIIPLSGSEIGNPWRGMQYYSDESPPPGWPLIDHYNRWCWGEIEPEEGQYNFAPIEQVLADAKAHGGKGGFTIMPVNTSDGHLGSCLPAYLRNVVSEPPDWNSPFYLNRLQALITALSQKYANDPRLGWIDIFGYGNWSEWNLSQLPANTPVATPATKRAIIDMSIKAFPHQYLEMNTDGNGHDGSGYDALDYALNLSPRVGVRSNCVGSPNMGGAIRDFQSLPSLSERWKIAPYITEYCGGSLPAPSFQDAQNQIISYHLAMLGDGAGNINDFNSYSPSDQKLMMLNYKTTGYRFILDSLILPSPLIAGEGFSVTAEWSNVNGTPAYNQWNVMIQLRNATSSVMWQGKSSVNLQKLLPTTDKSTGTDTPLSVVDNFYLPASVANGTYTISIKIVDPDNYYGPLQLAIQGRQADGSYKLGTVVVT